MAFVFDFLSVLNQVNQVLNIVNDIINVNVQKATEIRKSTGLDIKLDVVLIEQNGKKDLAIVLRGLPDVWDKIIAMLVDQYTNENVEVLRCGSE